MKSKFKHTPQANGVNLITKNGIPVAVTEKAPPEVAEKYPNVIALMSIDTNRPHGYAMRGAVADEICEAVLSALLFPRTPKGA